MYNRHVFFHIKFYHTSAVIHFYKAKLFIFHWYHVNRKTRLIPTDCAFQDHTRLTGFMGTVLICFCFSAVWKKIDFSFIEKLTDRETNFQQIMDKTNHLASLTNFRQSKPKEKHLFKLKKKLKSENKPFKLLCICFKKHIFMKFNAQKCL